MLEILKKKNIDTYSSNVGSIYITDKWQLSEKYYVILLSFNSHTHSKGDFTWVMHTYKSQEYPLVGLHLHKSKQASQTEGRKGNWGERRAKRGRTKRETERERETGCWGSVLSLLRQVSSFITTTITNRHTQTYTCFLLTKISILILNQSQHNSTCYILLLLAVSLRSYGRYITLLPAVPHLDFFSLLKPSSGTDKEFRGSHTWVYDI